MLTENHVVSAVCNYLRGRGFDRIKHLKTHQRGDDIIATRSRDNLEVFVEAKGETSARVGSYKHGKPFDNSQVLVHVATAFYRAAKMLQERPRGRARRIAIALPETDFHRRRVSNIETILPRLGIGIFWVAANRSIRLIAPWKL